MKLPASLCLSLTLTASLADAQDWRSTYYPENWIPPHEQSGLRFLTDSFIQDFSYAGYHRGERPLPDTSEGWIDVVEKYGADPTGDTDSTLAIQAALDFAGNQGGGVVYLPPGKYQVSLQEGENYCLEIRHSKVVLRGAGTEETFILNTDYQMRQSSVIRVRGSSDTWQTRRSSPLAIGKDYPGPTLELELEDPRLLRLLDEGDWIVVWYPATDDFVEELNMGPGLDGVSWLGDAEYLRGPHWLRQIAAIEDERIILDAPTRWKIDTRDDPVIYKAADFVMEAGLESFSIGNRAHTGDGWGEGDYTDSANAAWDTHASWLISMVGVTNCWVRDVSSYSPDEQDAHMLSNGLLLRYARGVSIQRVSMSNVQYGGGGGNGYGFRFSEANECMLVDSEAGFCRHGIVQWRMENSGNVFLRNLDYDSGFQWGGGAGNATSGRSSDHHGLFSFSNLFDSNVMERSYFQAAYRGDFGSDHGMTASQVVFWNTAGRAYFGSTDYIVHTQQFGQGYVIGTSGPANGVRTSENRPNSSERTDPVDFVEGLGDGENLAPSSLYVDQLIRRMADLNLLVDVTLKKQGNDIALQWHAPPGLEGNVQASDDLETWSDFIDLPDSDGEHHTTIPAKAFLRLIQR